MFTIIRKWGAAGGAVWFFIFIPKNAEFKKEFCSKFEVKSQC